jgi:hypothetical protein
MRLSLAAVTVTGAAAALLALGGPAHAAIVDRSLNEFTFTFGPVDCGAAVIWGEGDGRVLDTFRTRGPDGDVFGSFRGTVDFVYTNPATGRSWTSRDTFNERDSRVLSRDGDTVQMLVTAAQRSEIFDEDGALDSANRGMAQWVLSIDTQGTADPHDDDVSFAYPVRSHGSFTVGDFCDDALRFTTG